MSKSGRWSHPTLRMGLVISLLIVIQAGANAENNRVAHKSTKIKQMIEELKKQLGIAQEVQVIVVPKNDLIVSVKPLHGGHEIFELSFEEGFLQTLDEDDLRAVIAHELGHVWIFTHHPYLQTEDLANSVAYRAVSRAALDRVYEKVRERQKAASTHLASIH